ncbi:hypothetical protein PUN28_006439 [Cardiocondyla obscurior]|uniref:Uncharacterized protein n=1 Tax=Cardiocondyla obscurior TaxID=286306 RepID=A0AAW2GAA4_9HYME
MQWSASSEIKPLPNAIYIRTTLIHRNSKNEPTVQGVRRTCGRLPLRCVYLRGLQVFLRALVQQLEQHRRL